MKDVTWYKTVTEVDKYISGACAQIKYMDRTWRRHFSRARAEMYIARFM